MSCNIKTLERDKVAIATAAEGKYKIKKTSFITMTSSHALDTSKNSHQANKRLCMI